MDFDLYDDVLLGENYSEKDNALKLENESLRAKNVELSNKLRALSKVNQQLSEDIKKVEMNLSSLLKTSRNEINRKADAMTKLKSEMDRLVRQQAIRTGTRSEYEKVFDTYKASLEQFVLRKCAVPDKAREGILDELKVTTEDNTSTIVYGNSSITIFKDIGFSSIKKTNLKRQLEPEKENTCATLAKKQKLYHSKNPKDKSSAPEPDILKERKRLSEASSHGNDEKHVSSKKSGDPGTYNIPSDGSHRRHEGDKSQHGRSRKETEDRRDKWSRRQSSSANDSHKSSRNKTPTERLSKEDPSKTRDLEKDSRRSSRGKTSGERISDRDSRHAARSYHRDKVSKRESESQSSKKRQDSKYREENSKESDKNKDNNRRGTSIPSSARSDAEKLSQESRRHNMDSNSENKLPLSSKPSRECLSTNNGTNHPVKMNAPKDIPDTARSEREELEDGEIIFTVQPDDFFDMECEVSNPAKPLRPSQKLNCELFSESDDETLPNTEIKKKIPQSKDAKRLPADLSVIDSVDLTSMIEERKRQMNQLEKMKVKCLEKMKQPTEKSDGSSDTKSLKIRISLPKDTSSDGSSVEALKPNTPENRIRPTKAFESNLAGSSPKDAQVGRISDLTSPEGIANILKSDQFQPSQQSLDKRLSVSLKPNPSTNLRLSSTEGISPRRSPRKAIDIGSLKSSDDKKLSTSKRLQSNQKAKPSVSAKVEPVRTSLGKFVDEKDSPSTQPAGLSKRQTYVRSLKFSPEFQTSNLNSKSSGNLRSGREARVVKSGDKPVENYKESTKLSKIEQKSGKSNKSRAKRNPNFSLHTSVLASIDSPNLPSSVDDAASRVISKTPHKSEQSATSQGCPKFSTSKRNLVTSLGLDLSSDDDEEDDRLKCKPPVPEIKRSPRKKVQLEMCNNSNQLEVVFET